MHSIKLLPHNLLCYGVLMNFITSREKKKQSLFIYTAWPRKTITRPLKVSLYLTGGGGEGGAIFLCRAITMQSDSRPCLYSKLSLPSANTHSSQKYIYRNIHIYYLLHYSRYENSMIQYYKTENVEKKVTLPATFIS